MEKNFTNDENINLLWEIIYDFHNNNANSNANSKGINIDILKNNFIRKINFFIENSQKTNNVSDLLSMNKVFISNYVNEFSVREKQIEKINVKENQRNYEDEPKLVTFEDIQNSRMNEFEKELKLKQKSFDDAMSINVPETPNFKDKENDIPIGEMEDLISRTLAQRNFEIEQIHNKNMNPEEAEKWLKPQETSVKSDKVQQIKTDKKPIISQQNDNKRVTWDDNITFEIKEQNEISTNIFSKLKIQNQNHFESDKNKKNENENENKNLKDDIKNLQDEIRKTNKKLEEMNEMILKFLNNKKID
jgi:hypothetical protein